MKTTQRKATYRSSALGDIQFTYDVTNEPETLDEYAKVFDDAVKRVLNYEDAHNSKGQARRKAEELAADYEKQAGELKAQFKADYPSHATTKPGVNGPIAIKLTEQQQAENDAAREAEPDLIKTLTDIRDRLAKVLASAALSFSFGPSTPEVTEEQLKNAETIREKLMKDSALFDRMVEGMERRGYTAPWADFKAFTKADHAEAAKAIAKWQRYRTAWEVRQAKAGDIS